MLGRRLQSEKWEKGEFIRVLHSGLGFSVGFGVGSAKLSGIAWANAKL